MNSDNVSQLACVQKSAISFFFFSHGNVTIFHVREIDFCRQDMLQFVYSNTQTPSYSTRTQSILLFCFVLFCSHGKATVFHVKQRKEQTSEGRICYNLFIATLKHSPTRLLRSQSFGWSRTPPQRLRDERKRKTWEVTLSKARLQNTSEKKMLFTVFISSVRKWMRVSSGQFSFRSVKTKSAVGTVHINFFFSDSLCVFAILSSLSQPLIDCVTRPCVAVQPSVTVQKCNALISN